MSYSDEVIKVCNTVHELKGRCDRYEEEIRWLREVVLVLMSKATQPLYSYPQMTMEEWERTMRRGPTCGGLTVGEGVAPLTVGSQEEE